jgi:fermentation-respiration switch protein FrsA (DUF1100 family)
MAEGSPHHLLKRGEATHLPPMAIIQGTADTNVDHTWQDNSTDLYRTKGGTVEIHKFEGQPHSFITSQPDEPASKEAVIKIREFILGTVCFRKPRTAAGFL